MTEKAKKQPATSSDPVSSEETGNPWDRQPGERDAPWQAFRMYRDMGPTRTARKVAALIGRSGDHLLRYSHAWGWKERIQAYETHIDRVAQRAHEEELKKMAADHARAGRFLMVTALKVINETDIKDIKISDAIAMFRAAIPVERQSRLADQAHVPAMNMQELYGGVLGDDDLSLPQTGPSELP